MHVLVTKILIYKTLLKPIWTYGLQLWGNAKKSNILKIQTFQNIDLRKILNAPPYVSNHTLHTDTKLKTINELIKNLSTPSIPDNPPRRLKRKWCCDHLS